jgi:hypothetical protein
MERTQMVTSCSTRPATSMAPPRVCRVHAGALSMSSRPPVAVGRKAAHKSTLRNEYACGNSNGAGSDHRWAALFYGSYDVSSPISVLAAAAPNILGALPKEARYAGSEMSRLRS